MEEEEDHQGEGLEAGEGIEETSEEEGVVEVGTEVVVLG